VFGRVGVIGLLVQGFRWSASSGCVFVWVTEDCVFPGGCEDSSFGVAGVVSSSAVVDFRCASSAVAGIVRVD
jgi:hypothetical protein